MRYSVYAILVAFLLSTCAVMADPEPAPDAGKRAVTITTTAEARETRDYKVDATVKGKLPAEGGVAGDVDAAFSYKIRHRYDRRDDEGLMPVEVSLLEGRMTVQGQPIAITPELYPKLSVLVDRDWKITDIYGASESQLAQTLPGINYSNLIMLFYVPDGAKPHCVGDTWSSIVNLKAYGDRYKFTNTLKSLQTVNDVEAAVIRQEIVRQPRADGTSPAAMKATAESTFAIATGKLLKSHVECQVTPAAPSGTSDAPGQQDRSQYQANIKIDITPVQ